MLDMISGLWLKFISSTSLLYITYGWLSASVYVDSSKNSKKLRPFSEWAGLGGEAVFEASASTLAMGAFAEADIATFVPELAGAAGG